MCGWCRKLNASQVEPVFGGEMINTSGKVPLARGAGQVHCELSGGILSSLCMAGIKAQVSQLVCRGAPSGRRALSIPSQARSSIVTASFHFRRASHSRTGRRDFSGCAAHDLDSALLWCGRGPQAILPAEKGPFDEMVRDGTAQDRTNPDEQRLPAERRSGFRCKRRWDRDKGAVVDAQNQT